MRESPQLSAKYPHLVTNPEPDHVYEALEQAILNDLLPGNKERRKSPLTRLMLSDVRLSVLLWEIRRVSGPGQFDPEMFRKLLLHERSESTQAMHARISSIHLDDTARLADKMAEWLSNMLSLTAGGIS